MFERSGRREELMATSVSPRMVTPEVVTEITQGAKTIETRIREGRFQSWLALIAGLSSALSGVEVALLHYRGSYSRRIMYTPVILSVALLGAGVTAFRSRRAAKTALPAISALTLADCVVGSYFHVRGIQRKPGGWRLPLTNIAMGPPIFAPLLFGTSAYLGILASFLGRDDDPEYVASLRLGHTNNRNGWAKNLHEGRFQKHLAVVTALSASCSGFEAFYSHYKNNFRYKAQWTPVLLAPLLAATGLGAVGSKRVAQIWLPVLSVAAMADGAVGFGYHVRGVLRRPGGMKLPLYNVVHGPPVFSPLLFAAAGFFGFLASLLRREMR
jgi:hypothetical protein